MGKKVAILQSNYIPWKGYFDLIAYVDEFILYDDVQFTKQDWRNRNIIKTAAGTEWLTVPVKRPDGLKTKIKDVKIASDKWAERHWKTIQQNYVNTPYFSSLAPILEPIYVDIPHTHLSTLNRMLIEAVCKYLNIATVIKDVWDYAPCSGKNERLIDLCVQSGAGIYVSGTAAKSYLDEAAFLEAKIKCEWFHYGDYPEYDQQWGSFIHKVTILDLLFNCGPKAVNYMKFTQS